MKLCWSRGEKGHQSLLSQQHPTHLESFTPLCWSINQQPEPSTCNCRASSESCTVKPGLQANPSGRNNCCALLARWAIGLVSLTVNPLLCMNCSSHRSGSLAGLLQRSQASRQLQSSLDISTWSVAQKNHRLSEMLTYRTTIEW